MKKITWLISQGDNCLLYRIIEQSLVLFMSKKIYLKKEKRIWIGYAVSGNFLHAWLQTLNGNKSSIVSLNLNFGLGSESHCINGQKWKLKLWVFWTRLWKQIFFYTCTKCLQDSWATCILTHIYSILKLVNVLKLIWKMFQMQLDHNCTFLETKYYAYDNCNVLIMFFL